MTLTKREKLLISVLFGMLLLWLEYTYLLKGQLKSMDMAIDNLAKQEIKLERLNNAPETGKKLSAEISKGMVTIAEIMDKYFTTTEQEEVILLLNDLLSSSGVSATEVMFSEPKEVKLNEKLFSKSTVTLNCSTTYDSLFNLLKKTWDFQKAMVIDQMSVAINDSGMLEGSVAMDLYYLKGHDATLYKDNLYQMIVDESFYKGNPFIVSPGETDFRVNYLFTGGNEPGAGAYTPFADITGYWAEKEINTFGEKGYIIKGQDNNFNPDSPMTRGEFVIMLDKIYHWPMPDKLADMTMFSDYSSLGSYENAMSKAVLKGLMSGYVVGFTDKTLRPRDPITYEEIEFIMQKIKNEPAFTWNEVGKRLQEEKAVVSSGLTDKKNKVTKAESVYLMTYFK